MSDFEVLVYRINSPVTDHPDADRLSLVQIEGYTCISAKLEDGSHRYKEGDLVVYIPEGALLPEWMMKKMDFWDNNKNKPTFRYVKAKKLRGIFSQGILYPVLDVCVNGEIQYAIEIRGYDQIIDRNEYGHYDFWNVNEGDNVADALGITKYEPPVPTSMTGKVSGEYIQHTMKYDFDSIQKQWNMFEDGEPVIVTEKIHGTLIQIGYVPTLNDPELFGKGNIFVTSKGMGKQGFVYKNLPENKDNLYVRILNQLLENKLADRLEVIAWNFEQQKEDTVHLFGEVFGVGVQDLTYGQKTPTLHLFDMAFDKEFMPYYCFKHNLGILEIEPVPILYEGPFDRKLMEELRDGKDFSGTHIREGIVIKSLTEDRHPRYGRKIAKWVSPDYLLRKDGTEYN